MSTLDEQISYAQQLVNDGLYPEYTTGILASLRELKAIKEAVLPEPVKWWRWEGSAVDPFDESAPKDGTPILAYCGDDFQAVCYWSTSIWVTNGGAWIYDECRSDTVELNPTHWMPLPPPPKG